MRPELQVAEARLLLAEHLTCASDLEVPFGEQEAVGAVGHRLQTGLAVGRGRVTEEEAPRGPPAAADTTAQLVQLREPEALGAVDDHHGRVRHVDAHLDHGRGHEHVDVTGAERSHAGLLLRRLHLAVQETQAQAGELFGPQTLELGRRVLGLDLG